MSGIIHSALKCPRLTPRMSLAGDRAAGALRREPLQPCVPTPPPNGNPDCGAFGVGQRLTAVGGREDQRELSALLQTGPEHKRPERFCSTLTAGI